MRPSSTIGHLRSTTRLTFEGKIDSIGRGLSPQVQLCVLIKEEKVQILDQPLCRDISVNSENSKRVKGVRTKTKINLSKQKKQFYFIPYF